MASWKDVSIMSTPPAREHREHAAAWIIEHWLSNLDDHPRVASVANGEFIKRADLFDLYGDAVADLDMEIDNIRADREDALSKVEVARTALDAVRARVAINREHNRRYGMRFSRAEAAMIRDQTATAVRDLAAARAELGEVDLNQDTGEPLLPRMPTVRRGQRAGHLAFAGPRLFYAVAERYFRLVTVSGTYGYRGIRPDAPEPGSTLAAYDAVTRPRATRKPRPATERKPARPARRSRKPVPLSELDVEHRDRPRRRVTAASWAEWVRVTATVECERCGADPGRWCDAPDGEPHLSRRIAYGESFTS